MSLPLILRTFTAILIFTSAVATAELNSVLPRNVQFSNLDTEVGLSSEFVHDVEQDTLGFMWFATQSGLNRFDGHEVRVYENNANDPYTIGHSFVWDIYRAEEEGDLWLGTERGVSYYSHKEDKFYREPFPALSLTDYRVRQIVQDSKGVFWLGTLGEGLLRIDPESNSLTQFELDEADKSSLPNNHVMSLLIDQRGQLWIGTDGGGLARFDNGNQSFVRYQAEPGNNLMLSDDRIRRIYEDRRGRLWIGTASGGMNLFEPQLGRFTQYVNDPAEPLSMPSGQITAIFEDRHGTLWVGSETGLAEWRPGIEAFIRYQFDAANPGSLINNRINVIMQDDSGVLWVGTHGGISRWNYFSDTFTYYRSKDGFLVTDLVTAVGESSNGKLWVGTYGGGLSSIDPQTGEVNHYRHDENIPDSLPDDRVMVVYIDNEDRVWAGTRSAGLVRKKLDGDGFERFVHDLDDPQSLSANAITSILEDRAGGLWVGTFGGGLNYASNIAEPAFEHFKHDPELPSSLSGDRVLKIYEDYGGSIWIGTEGDGLNQLDHATGHVTRFDLDEGNNNSGRPKGTPWEIMETPDRTMWIGTLGQGLFRWTPEDRQAGVAKFTQYASAQGLASDIYAISSGSADRLWLSSNRGLFEFDIDSVEVRKFDRYTGLLGNEFNQGARLRSRTGQLLFGSNQGLVGFFPGDLPSNERVPVVAIEANSRTGSLARTWTGGDVPTIELAYFDAFIAFSFIALDFVSPDKNEYRYRLEGLDSEWTTVQNFRQAIFSSLSPGSYTFQVEASNNDGVWNRHSTEIHVDVVPPPWSSWWAYVIYGLLIIFVIALYLNNQRSKRLAEAETRTRLETLVTERTTELADRNADLMSLNDKLEHASVTDALTGLRNRRFVDEHMVAELSKLRRSLFEKSSHEGALEMLFLMMIDLDGFKAINDQYGHQAGDLALLGVKDRLIAVSRKSDVVVRWGGDEFLIIGHSKNLTGVERFMEKVRVSLSAMPYDVGDDNEGFLSGSIGVAPIPFVEDKIDFADWEQICRVADTAAYFAKDSGRDAWVSVTGTSGFQLEDLVDIRESLPDLMEAGKVRLKSSKSLTDIFG